MYRRWWGTGEPGAGIVVADGLNDTGYDSTEHANDASCRDGGHPPLKWVWNLKPWGYQKYALPGICACIVAVVGAVGREDVSHREDEAQQPGHEDSQDYLEWATAESSR